MAADFGAHKDGLALVVFRSHGHLVEAIGHGVALIVLAVPDVLVVSGLLRTDEFRAHKLVARVEDVDDPLRDRLVDGEVELAHSVLDLADLVAGGEDILADVAHGVHHLLLLEGFVHRGDASVDAHELLKAGELGQLRHELLVVHGVQGVLMLELRHEQLKKGVLAEVGVAALLHGGLEFVLRLTEYVVDAGTHGAVPLRDDVESCGRICRTSRKLHFPRHNPLAAAKFCHAAHAFDGL